MTPIQGRKPFAWTPIPRSLPNRLLAVWFALWEVSDLSAGATYATNGEIAEVMGASESTVVRGLRGLERLGLIRRSFGPGGNRRPAVLLLYKDELVRHSRTYDPGREADR